MKLSREAVTLLRKVKRHILAEPKRIAMRVWRTDKPAYIRPYKLKVPPCGTVACIGGWVEVLSKTTKEAWDILGLADAQQAELFFDYELQRAPRQQTPAHARAVADHIDRFIEKYT